MAAPEETKEKKSRTHKTKDTTFRCTFCDQIKPLDNMKIITRFFPPLVVCRECEQELR
ncbi:hypothetical protein ACFLWZ_01295 [Chloroflexota bacterium]